MEKKIAEFVGIMLGDGSIGYYKNKNKDKIKEQYVVKTTLDSRNKEYTDYVQKIMEEVLGKKPIPFYRNKENTVDLRVFGKIYLEKTINEIGLKYSPKWNTMIIPKKYFKKELFSFIVKGLFDTDGCLSIFNNNGILYLRIEIKICPSPAQNQFIEIFKRLEIKHTVRKLDKEKIVLRINGKEQLRKWFKFIGSSNPIHIEKYRRFLKE